MEINVSDLTTMDLQGDGVFDNIMTAMQTRLDREYKRNRLVGPEYAKVYLGSYEASLMNSIQFILGRQEAGAKADLIKEQTKTEVKQRKLVVAQISKMAAEERLIDGQIDKMEQEILVMKGEVSMIPHKIELLVAEVEKMRKEGELIDGQIKKMVQEILLMEGQVKKMAQEVLVMEGEVKMIPSKLALLGAQADKTIAEIELVKGQVKKMTEEILVMEQQVKESIQKVETMRASVWAERAKTNTKPNIFDVNYDPTGLSEVTGIVGAQIRKSDAEGDLIEKKGITEAAQTNDLVGTPLRAVTGVIGKQKALFQKQTDGFDRDAEQKLSKIMVDTWNVRRTTDDQYSAGGTGLEDTQINNVLNIAKDGINAPRNVSGGFIPEVSLGLFAKGNILQGQDTPYAGRVLIENNPSLSVYSWRFVAINGVPASQYKRDSDPDPQKFTTRFEKSGVHSISMEIVIADSGAVAENDGKTLIVTQSFYVVPVVNKLAVSATEITAATKWFTDNPDKTMAPAGVEGMHRTAIVP